MKTKLTHELCDSIRTPKIEPKYGCAHWSIVSWLIIASGRHLINAKIISFFTLEKYNFVVIAAAAATAATERARERDLT